MTARIRINRGNLPAIKLGQPGSDWPGVVDAVLWGGEKWVNIFSGDAFIQQLANGRWHVMRRIDDPPQKKIVTPLKRRKSRCPEPPTQAFEDARDRIIAAEMPNSWGKRHETTIRLWLTR